MSGRCRSFLALPCVTMFALVFASGCGSKTATVEGVVSFQGKPVTDGSVVFYCSDKQIVRCLIGADGRYSIPNVPCGTAVVTVQSHAQLPAGLNLRQQLPPSTGGPVLPGGNAGERPGRGRAIPPRYALPEESGLWVAVDGGFLTYDIDLKP